MQVQIMICGVPCLSEVTDYQIARPVNWSCPMEDAEPPDDEYAEFELRDMDGNENPYLDALYWRLTDAERDALEGQVINKIRTAPEAVF